MGEKFSASYGITAMSSSSEIWLATDFSGNSGLKSQERLGDLTCRPHITSEQAG